VLCILHKTTSITVKLAHWSEHSEALSLIRQRVFIDEQNVPEHLEWDDSDHTYQHIIAIDSANSTILPVGCLRISPTGKIGRVAVLPQYRGQNLGVALMQHALEYCQVRQISPSLDAQIAVTQFYRKFGFIAQGAPFDDAGIEHIHMVLGDQDQDLCAKSDVIRTDHLTESAGYWQLFNQDISRKLDICCNDINHPLFINPLFLTSLSAFLRLNRHAHLRLLISNATKQLSDHPLIKLQQRISSKITVKTLDTDCITTILADQKRWFKITPPFCVLNFNDRAGLRQKQEEFECLWKQGNTAKNARRLYL
jgi:predicted GNAT family N-acyltransferase